MDVSNPPLRHHRYRLCRVLDIGTVPEGLLGLFGSPYGGF